jgi:hypothetical protein
VAGGDAGRVRFFTDEHPDGLTAEGTDPVSWCPRCQEKRAAERHESCPYFRGEVVDDDGRVSAVICALPEEHYGGPPPEKS